MGYRVSARAIVRVAGDAATGSRRVLLHLPGLSGTAAELSAEVAEGADTPSELTLHRPDTLVVATVVARSAAGRFFNNIRGFIVSGILVLCPRSSWCLTSAHRVACCRA